MKNIPVALQLYSLREDMKIDFARTVAEVAKIGYKGVELAGYGNLDAAQAKIALGNAGLEIAGMHVGIDALRRDITAVIDQALLFSLRHVTCSWWPPSHYVSVAAVQEIGAELGRFGAILRAYGLRFGFHNHAGEFKLLEGRPVFSWMLGAAEPRNLSAQLDVYWAHVGGYPPARFLRAQGERVPLVHLKDEKELGLGPVKFADVFAAIESIGVTEWYIVEQEQYNHAPLESVRRCFDQLKAWGKA